MGRWTSDPGLCVATFSVILVERWSSVACAKDNMRKARRAGMDCEMRIEERDGEKITVLRVV